MVSVTADSLFRICVVSLFRLEQLRIYAFILIDVIFWINDKVFPFLKEKKTIKYQLLTYREFIKKTVLTKEKKSDARWRF